MPVTKFQDCKYNSLELAIKFQELANKFLDYFENHETQLNFAQLDIDYHPCATVACHGGFAYCILSTNPLDEAADFADGAELLAEYLGFDSMGYLEFWAMRNHHIWGNLHGSKMFCSRGHLAFGKSFGEKITLEDIAKHYSNVAYNLENLKTV